MNSETSGCRRSRRPGTGSNQRGIAQGWLLLIGIIVFIVVLGGLYNLIDSRGYQRGAGAVTAKWEQANREQREREAKQADVASQSVEAGNAKAKVVYRTITKEVDKVVDREVYRNVCLDADGLRIANTALNAGESPDPGKPDRPVPRPVAAFRWEWGLSAAQTR